MKDLSFKNIYKNWLKLWPLNLVLLVIGLCVGGYMLISSNRINIEVETKTLVLNETASLVEVNDYYHILNNIISDKNAATTECLASSSQSGNVLAITTSCGESEEDAKVYASNLLADFDKTLKNIYGEGVVRLETFKEPTLKDVAMPRLIDAVFSLLAPILAMLVVSMIIALATI